jgi:hypothetical protein
MSLLPIVDIVADNDQLLSWLRILAEVLGLSIIICDRALRLLRRIPKLTKAWTAAFRRSPRIAVRKHRARLPRN